MRDTFRQARAFQEESHDSVAAWKNVVELEFYSNAAYHEATWLTELAYFAAVYEVHAALGVYLVLL